MYVYIGIDDTDSRNGMCTTYLTKIIVKELHKQNLDLIGPPRLVRLNPNIPWKTRGNGAVTLHIGKGYGPKKIVGEIEGKAIYAFKYGKNANVDINPIIKSVKKYFITEEQNTNPGIVFSKNKLPESIYWLGVRRVLEIKQIEDLLREYGATFFKVKNGRGIIGASAAISWRARHYTYELLTYLPENMWNTDRYIDRESVIKMDSFIKTTFDNYDFENNYIAIEPHSKTPVLFGIRGTNPEDLISAKEIINSTRYDTWFLFLTNQGSDDHIIKKKIKEINEFENVAVKGIVYSNPTKITGGHVIFKLKDDSGTIDCTAYEPTKKFRNVIENLHEGDYVEVYGSVRSEPKTINIEKIHIIKLENIKIKIANPVCPKCGKSMESIGKNKGYRCKRCRIKVPEEEATYSILKRDLEEGWYEVPVIARRHLAKPLKLFDMKSSKIF